MQPRISVIIPCYNEQQHIEVSFGKIRNYLSHFYKESEFEIILIDDCSSDKTKSIIKNFENKNISVYVNEKNLGRGATVKKGIELAKGEIIGFLDIDCEVAEYYLTKFIYEIEMGSDLAVGSRIYKVSLVPYIFLRHFLSLSYKAFLNYFLNINIQDTETGFKFFSKKFAKELIQYSFFNDWFFDTEICYLACKFKYKISEISVAFIRNESKKSTVKVLRDSFKYFLNLFVFWELVRSGKYDKRY